MTRTELAELTRRELTALEAAGGEAGEEATSDDPHDGYDVSGMSERDQGTHAELLKKAREKETEAKGLHDDSAGYHAAQALAHLGRAHAARFRKDEAAMGHHSSEHRTHEEMARVLAHDGHDVSHLPDHKQGAHEINIRNARRGEEEARQARPGSADWHDAMSDTHQWRHVAASIRGDARAAVAHAAKRDEHRRQAVLLAKHDPEMGSDGFTPDQIAKAHFSASLVAPTKAARSAHTDAESAWRGRSSRRDATIGKHNDALKKSKIKDTAALMAAHEQ